MPHLPNPLTAKQCAVITDLWCGRLSNEAICEKHNLRPHVLESWLADPTFQAQLRRRRIRAIQRTRSLLARNAPKAARKLIELMHSEKEDVSRRASLDIIAATIEKRHSAHRTKKDKRRRPPALDPKTADKMLRFLANEPPKQKPRNSRKKLDSPPVN